MEKRSTAPLSQKSKAESGKPGGGKGRREDTHGSGIYPASGPLPRGPATISAQGALGRKQPARSAQTSGALMVRPATKRVERGKTTRRKTSGSTAEPGDIERAEWETFINRFSASHEGCDTRLQVFAPDQTSRIEAQGLPLEGISIEIARVAASISVFLGEESADHISHTIEHVSHVTAIGDDEFEIEAADMSRSIVSCFCARK